MRTIRVGYSPCPNDTFLFYALVHGLVDGEGYSFEPLLEDVETLNEYALGGRLEMTKASYGVVPMVAREYWCLRSGGALGRGCGPLVVARDPRSLDELARKPIAVPGDHTTASLLLDLRLGRPAQRVPMRFSDIMPAVAEGRVGAGLVIHEGRFTFPSYGLAMVEDLGRWWEGRTGLPIPLGVILLRRHTPDLDPKKVQRALRRSVEFAMAHPEEPMPYVRAHAQELDDSVIRQHIGLYVNEFSRDVGPQGQQAAESLLTLARWTEAPAPLGQTLFPPEES